MPSNPTVEIFGLSFHSPLLIKMLLPSTYHAVYISHDWGGSNFRKNLEPTVKQAFGSSKTPILLAGNLTVLQQFLREYPDFERFKVLLFDFPGVMVPFEDPLIEWLDCDHQAGGAWQTAKIKMERFALDLENLSPLSVQGKDLIGRMKRFCPRESRVSEIESFTEMFAEGLPKDYRDLLSSSTQDVAKVQEPEIDIDWKSQTFRQVLSEVLRQFDDSHLKQVILNLALNYQVGKISKREFTSNCNKSLGNREHLKKLTVVIKKWMDDKKLGRALYMRYLDYLANSGKRGWQTILNEGKIGVAEEDLLILIAFQPRSPDILSQYQDQLKAVEQLEPDANPTKLHHPDPPDLKTLF